jgi:hypothetical protein
VHLLEFHKGSKTDETLYCVEELVFKNRTATFEAAKMLGISVRVRTLSGFQTVHFTKGLKW